jgi:hypothetical protein
VDSALRWLLCFYRAYALSPYCEGREVISGEREGILLFDETLNKENI